MPPKISQENRSLRATTPLGADALVAVALTGEEEVSRPYLFTVDFVSSNADVSASSVLGKPMTLHIPLADGDARAIHGQVRRFTALGRHKGEDLVRYRAEVVPALWFLSLSSDCRTFENLSALDIVEKVCKAGGVTNVKRRVSTSLPTLPYVVQYRETNLAFVSRMLEEAGLYYTFEHTEDSHTLIFSDSRAGSIPACSTASAKVDPDMIAGRPQTDVVFALRREYAVHAAAEAVADHDFLRADDTASMSSASPGARGERFDFVGDLGPKDSAQEAKRRIELDEVGHDVLYGASTCAAFESGTRVEIGGGPLDAGGVALHLLRVTHQIEVGDVLAGSGLMATYKNEFMAIPAAVGFRPKRMNARSSVRGTQTAKVVGSGGTGEIDVDAEARVLLQFPWDRGDGKDGGSKHRVHVASVWAGTAWGFVQIPRVGQEVLVEFLEGDPERPIVTGRVFNSAHKPPYALPANKTQSGWKSRTLGGGSDNFNELRFEDKKGAEQVYAQAEKDLKVLVKNDETRDVQHDRTTTIKNNDTRTVTEGNDAHKISKGNQTVEISQGNRSVTVSKGNDTLAVDTGNLTVGVSAGNIEIKAKAKNITIEAGTQIELKVGSNSIVISTSGVTIKGTTVKSEAQAMNEMKGAMAKVEGSGMVTVKGGITMIN